MGGRGGVCESFSRPRQYPGASLEAATEGGDSKPHTPGTGTAMDPVVGSGWGDRAEGTWPDLWAVFTPAVTHVKYLQALPYLTLVDFGPILQLRRLRLRESDFNC